MKKCFGSLPVTLRLFGFLLILGMFAGTAVFAAADVAINAANFPDPAFLKLIQEGGYDYNGDGILSPEEKIDQNHDGFLTDDEIASVTAIDCTNMSISTLKGIERFSALTRLFCYGNRLKSLDPGDNPELILLECAMNRMTSLTTDRNRKLKYLYCQDNQLTNLDLSRNTLLQNLSCGDNKLTELDLSKNTELSQLGCYRNNLSSLDVSHNAALTHLSCYGNKLSTLDVSRNTKLEFLSCGNNGLKNLDLSRNRGLTTLECIDNQLSSLDLQANTKLETLNTEINQFRTLDISASPTLCGYLKTYPRSRKEYYGKPYDSWGSGDMEYLSCDTTVTVIAGGTVSEPTEEFPPEVGEEILLDGLKFRITSSKTASFLGLQKAKSRSSLRIPDSIKCGGKTFRITEIEKNAMAGDTRITLLILGDKVKTIGEKAFASCTKLKKVSNGAAVLRILDSAFQGCKAMKVFPAMSKLSSIGANAFKGCAKLEKIQLGKDVKFVGKNAFNGCKGLKTITVKTKKLTDKNVKAGAFKGIHKNATFRCPKGKLNEYKKLFIKKGAPKTCKFE